MTMTSPSPQPASRVLFSSAGRGWTALEADFVHRPPGLTRAPAGERHVLGMHFGPPVNADCTVGGVRRRGVQKSGDTAFVPAGADGLWEDDAACRLLRLVLRPSLLEQVAVELGKDAAKVELRPRLGLRDIRIDAIGWAIKAELEADVPSDPLYIDSLASALAVCLIEMATAGAPEAARSRAPGLSARRLRMLVDFIEMNLDQTLRLADLAAAAGLSATRLKTAFRESMGMPLHQYVIRRRVEYARALITTTAMPVSRIASAAGFAHQSHMTSTMRRVLGRTPSEIARSPDEI